MPQDLTHYLWMSAGVDLPRGMTMTERVRADPTSVEAGSTRVHLNAMADGGGGQRTRGQSRADEESTVRRRRRSFIPDIDGQCTGDRREER